MPASVPAEHPPLHRGRRAVVVDVAVVALLLVAALIVHRWDMLISDTFSQLTFHRHFFGRVLQLLGKVDVIGFCIIFVAWALGDRLLLWRFTLSMTSAAIIVWVLKISVGRHRPNRMGMPVSFPSGDAAVAFVWAAMVSAHYPVIALPAFAVAAAVAVLRVTGGYHYPSDILVGAAIGYAAGRYAAASMHRVPGFLYRLTRGARFFAISVIAVLLGSVFRVLMGNNLAPVLVAVIVVAASVAVRQMREHKRRQAKTSDSP